MTRREVWAWAVLLSLMAMALLAHILLGLIADGGLVDEHYLAELKLGVWAGGSVCILSIIGWAVEASKPGRHGAKRSVN